MLVKAKDILKKFSKIEKENHSELIEIHNRPNYLHYLVDTIGKRNYVLYFHNDPLTMTGSKSILERKFLLKNTSKFYLIAIGQKKDFLKACKISLLIVINYQ